MKQTLRRRIILSVGLSTCVLMSLYWLVGWQLVERIEQQNSQRFVDYIGSRVDRVLTGEVPPEALELFDMLRLYRNEAEVPAAWRDLAPPQVRELPGDDLLIARAHPQTGAPYYLVLHQLEQVLEGEEQEKVEVGLVIGGIALITLGAMGLTLLLTWRLTVPIRELTQQLEHIDPAQPALKPLARNDEIGFMSRQFAALLDRTAAFIRRERDFTRFASHELRSPVMVMRSSLDLLRETVPPTDLNRRALKRIDDATARMNQLIEAFLWLGREAKPAPVAPIDRPALERLLGDLVAGHAGLHPERLALSLGECRWAVAPFVLSVVLDNLLRNALVHGEGRVSIRSDATRLELHNAVAEVPAGGHGYGLLIVEQLCQQAGIRLETDTDAGGFHARLHFDAIQAAPASAAS